MSVNEALSVKVEQKHFLPRHTQDLHHPHCLLPIRQCISQGMKVLSSHCVLQADPYLELEVRKGRSQITDVGHGKDPEWNVVLSFTIDDPETQDLTVYLKEEDAMDMSKDVRPSASRGPILHGSNCTSESLAQWLCPIISAVTRLWGDWSKRWSLAVQAAHPSERSAVCQICRIILIELWRFCMSASIRAMASCIVLLMFL